MAYIFDSIFLQIPFFAIVWPDALLAIYGPALLVSYPGSGKDGDHAAQDPVLDQPGDRPIINLESHLYGSSNKRNEETVCGFLWGCPSYLLHDPFLMCPDHVRRCHNWPPYHGCGRKKAALKGCGQHDWKIL
nr:hypothetical protein [Enterocloster clostridioformis]